MSAEQELANANVQIANLISEVTRFRDAAMGLNAIYPTITEGRQTVADGKYFSVPGNGAYMRLYRRTGSSAALIAEFPDRAELNSVIAQLGPLLGRGVVGGSGDLMAQGAFGLGGTLSPAVSTLKAEFLGGLNRLSGSTEGSPPRMNSNYWGLGIFGQSHQGRHHCLINEHTGNSSAPRLWIGSRTSDPEIDWSFTEACTNRNILGTVSQSDGVPTGAIIEYGDNANGSWVTLAGGLTLCIRNVELDMSTNNTAEFFTPVSFKSPPVGGGSLEGASSSQERAYAAGIVFRARVSAWSLLRAGLTTVAATRNVSLYAIGFR